MLSFRTGKITNAGVNAICQRELRSEVEDALPHLGGVVKSDFSCAIFILAGAIN
jgi:hypothetical protein